VWTRATRPRALDEKVTENLLQPALLYSMIYSRGKSP
jgi:hypothetical protein